MAPAASTGSAAEDAPGGLTRDALRRMRRNPTAIVGLVLISLFVLVAIFAPLLAPFDPKFQRLDLIRPGQVPGPSREFLLGLDALGRDELSRIIYGARYSLLIGVVSLTLGAAGGLLLGLIAGAFGGWRAARLSPAEALRSVG